MKRRSFVSSMLLGLVAPMFLPGAGSLWVKNREVVLVRYASCRIGLNRVELGLIQKGLGDPRWSDFAHGVTTQSYDSIENVLNPINMDQMQLEFEERLLKIRPPV